MHKQMRYAPLGIALAILGSTVVLAQQIVSPGVHPISGRRYAQTMSYLGADWLDRSERVQEEEPDVALDAIKLVTGSTVADGRAGPAVRTPPVSRVRPVSSW